MYERFTDRARKIMALAHQEAQRFNHEHIDTEHILLGFIREGSGVGATVLKILNVDINKLRLDAEKLMIKRPNIVERDRLPHSPRAKKVIEYAIEEMRALGHQYLGSEHLFLGLLRETNGVAAKVLMNHNITCEKVRSGILDLVGENTVARDTGTIQGFSERARKILSLSNQEAQRFNHEYIDTEHILLGCISIGSGVGMAVLKNLNVDIKKLRIDVEKLIIRGADIVEMGKLPLSPRAKKVIEYAMEGAKSLKQNYVGSEHLLLGLMYETKGSISAQVLMGNGLTYEQVRSEILKLAGG